MTHDPLRILALLSEPLVGENDEPIPRLDLHKVAERVCQQLGAIDSAAALRFVPVIPIVELHRHGRSGRTNSDAAPAGCISILGRVGGLAA